MVGLLFVRDSNVSGDGHSCGILYARYGDQQEVGVSGHPHILQLGSDKRRDDGRLEVRDQRQAADWPCSGLLQTPVFLRYPDAVQRPAGTAFCHEKATR